MSYIRTIPTKGDICSFVELLPKGQRFCIVTHPGCATVYACHQLYSIGRPMVHELRNENTPEGAEDWMTYNIWPPAWKLFDHILWMVREPIRVVYSMNALFAQPRGIGIKILKEVCAGLPDRAKHWLEVGDYLSAAAFSVYTLNLRALSWRLPLFRVEDLVQRVETTDLKIKAHAQHTHHPETALWSRLADRNPELCERLMEDTLRFGYEIKEEHLEPPPKELESLGSLPA